MTLELDAAAEFLTGTRRGAGEMPWWLLRTEDLLVLREWAGEALQPVAQKRLLREVRRALRRTLDREAEAGSGARAKPALLRARRRPIGTASVSARQARLLFEVHDEDGHPEARRDSAAIALVMFAGLRRNELVNLLRSDYDDDEGRVTVASRRGYARCVMLSGSARRALEIWLAVRGDWPGPLIAAVDASGRVLQRGVSPAAVNRLVAKRAREAGCARLTPNELRLWFLWQLRSACREAPRCRYYQDEAGRPAWVLPAIHPG